MSSAWQEHEQARCVAVSKHLTTLSRLVDGPPQVDIDDALYECFMQLSPLLLATP